MLKAVTKTVYFLLHKYTLNSQKTGLLILIGLSTIYNIKFALADNSNITINKNTIDENVIVSGTSGGTVRVLEIAQTENTPTGYCDGFVDSQPNHILKIDTFFEHLRLEIESPADTTVLIKGDRGVWCNDDYGSANPIIEGQWQPGIYQVWVGSYQLDSRDSYQIKITD